MRPAKAGAFSGSQSHQGRSQSPVAWVAGRRETERPEAVEMGTVRLSGVEKNTIVSDALQLLTDTTAYSSMATAVNPYGDGHASERIHRAVKEFLDGSA